MGDDMQAVLAVLGASLRFGVSHVGLATRRVREPLVSRIGERAFMWGYWLLASALFALLVVTYARVRYSGPVGLDLRASCCSP